MNQVSDAYVDEAGEEEDGMRPSESEDGIDNNSGAEKDIVAGGEDDEDDEDFDCK